MVEIGKLNTLQVVHVDSLGAYLDGGDDGDVFMARVDCPEQPVELGQKLEVFVFLDSEDLLAATSVTPLAMVGDFAVLRVSSVQRVGAFLDWGLSKDLLLPYAEQNRDLRSGDIVLVYLYVDKSERICASMRVHKHVEGGDLGLKGGEEVELVIAAKTDLGYKALVNGRTFGMLYADEVFAPLQYADQLKGYIKYVRPDGKLDLSLARPGHQAASEEIAPRIVEQLKADDGFIPLNDKSSAEEIHKMFGVSRKKFKIALGGLYKQRVITVEKDGIRLV